MKRKITLGLIVFFAGVLLTACGSSSSPNAVPIATSTDLSIDPSITRPVGCTTPCTVNQTGYLTSSNAQLFAQAIGDTSVVTTGGPTIEPIFVDRDGDGKLDFNLPNTISTGLTSYIECYAREFFGGDCTPQYGSNNSTSNLNGAISRVPIDLQYNFSGNSNEYDSIAVTLNNTQSMEYYLGSNGTFGSANGYYALYPGNKSWTLTSSQGDVGVAR